MGIIGGVVSVVTITLAVDDRTETFPAASYAAIVYVYVPGGTPLSLYEVALRLVICESFL
jgi:hypothetical protein